MGKMQSQKPGARAATKPESVVAREERVVGTTGFEPATSRTPSVRATRLRYVPTAAEYERITGVREASRKRAECRADRAAFCGSKVRPRFHCAALRKLFRNRRTRFRGDGGARRRS